MFDGSFSIFYQKSNCENVIHLLQWKGHTRSQQLTHEQNFYSYRRLHESSYSVDLEQIVYFHVGCQRQAILESQWSGYDSNARGWENKNDGNLSPCHKTEDPVNIE